MSRAQKERRKNIFKIEWKKEEKKLFLVSFSSLYVVNKKQCVYIVERRQKHIKNFLMYERHERTRRKIQNGRSMWFILYTFSQSKVISFFLLSLLTAVVVAAAAVHVENENRIQGKYMRLRANLLPHVWAADWMRKNIWGKKIVWNFFLWEKKECNFLCRKNILLIYSICTGYE